jgi:hypothetical protein
MRLGEGSAEDREVLAEQVDQSPVDGTVSGDHAVPENLPVFQAEIGGPMGDEAIHLHEGAFVQEKIDAFAGGELAPSVLCLDPFGPSPLLRQAP